MVGTSNREQRFVRKTGCPDMHYREPEDLDRMLKNAGLTSIHTELNEMELLEIEGEMAILKHLEESFKELEELEICK